MVSDSVHLLRLQALATSYHIISKFVEITHTIKNFKESGPYNGSYHDANFPTHIKDNSSQTWMFEKCQVYLNEQKLSWAEICS